MQFVTDANDVFQHAAQTALSVAWPMNAVLINAILAIILTEQTDHATVETAIINLQNDY